MPSGSSTRGRVQRVEVLARDRRSSRRRSRRAARPATRPIAAVNSFMPEVQAVHVVVGLAVVAEGAGELDSSASARRACRPRRWRSSSSARTTRCPRRPRSRPAAVPVGAVRVGAVLDQEDALGAAELGDPLDIERDVAADVDDERRARLVLGAPWPRSPRTTCRGPRGCSRRTRPWRRRANGERRRHERVRRAEDGLPRTPAYASAASAAPVQLESRPPEGRSTRTTPARTPP